VARRQFLRRQTVRDSVRWRSPVQVYLYCDRGSPGTATEILNLYAYRTSFSGLNLGYGAALAMVLLAITLGVSFVMFRVRTQR
jgi:ABC-type sugar transport system permease subunit